MTGKLMGEGDDSEQDRPLGERIASNPRPAAVWALGLLLLLVVEIGALLQGTIELGQFVAGVLPGEFGLAVLNAAKGIADTIPTLLSRETIPNQGYRVAAEGPWEETFLGLEPALAWAVRVIAVYLYVFVFLGWLWKGYLTFRRHYRQADWTPKDDMVDRLRGHRWGQFGLIIVIMFVTMALFAPTLGPTTVESNIMSPYSNEITYFDEDTGEPQDVIVGVANVQSRSVGAGDRNVGPMSYDEFDRFHPFGTTTNGKDLFTFMAHGARISLTIGVVSMGLAGAIALAMALISAYYKGLTDLLIVISSDSIQALPVFLVLILASVVFAQTWLAQLWNGAILLIILFALIRWPYLWRAIRGPTFQISEREWIDAAKSFGQKPRVIMRKHMAPYVIGYLLVYGSMSLGGVIIAVAGLSFLGLGIAPPTPEWGRAIDEGQRYVATQSWHISLIPGILITLVVTAFNALGDGIRDAIDPESEGGKSEEAGAAGGAGA
ncbi:MAG: ABC transporter permease [Halodesulfurarchaeum sp.]